jgi:TolA-binding protein
VSRTHGRSLKQRQKKQEQTSLNADLSQNIESEFTEYIKGIEMTYNMKHIAFVGILALSLSAPLSAHAEKTTLSDVRSEISETFDSIANYSESKRDQAVEKIQQSLNSLDKSIDQLEDQTRENWQNMTEAAREKSKAALRDIRHKRNILSERFGELKSGSSDAWDELRDGFSEAWSDLKESWEATFTSEKTEGNK